MKSKLFRSLEWYHWVVVVLSLALTLSAWHITRTQAYEKSEALFKFQSGQVIDLLVERMAKYEEALRAGVAMLRVMPPEMSRAEWKEFAATLNVEERFPGINGIGVIHFVPSSKKAAFLAWQRSSMPNFVIFPAHDKNEFWPISYIEPIQTNFKAVGLDMAHEQNRYNAATKARDERSAQITGPINLVQDDQQTPGFLFYVPWYTDEIPSTYGDESSKLAGLVYAPFIVNKLMGGALSNVNDLINFTIRDQSTLLFEDVGRDTDEYQPMFAETREVGMYGRIWTFELETSRAFAEQVETVEPTVILVTGIVIDILLITLFLTLSQTKQRATQLAHKATRRLNERRTELELAKAELIKQNEELIEANKELDRFAFVASHDLKAPLRGIAQLSEWIEDETQGTLSEDAERYLKLLKSRILRLERLLNALLQYSRVDKKGQPFEAIDFPDFVSELFSLNAHPQGFELRLEENVQEVTTDKEALGRVLGNVMNNAVKHHHRDSGVITVTSRWLNGALEIHIADDGPGIPLKYQDRVFELFHTLKPRDEVEGSGLGLAIVKKIIEKMGGSYRLETNLSGGLTFVIVWPISEKSEVYSGEGAL